MAFTPMSMSMSVAANHKNSSRRFYGKLLQNTITNPVIGIAMDKCQNINNYITANATDISALCRENRLKEALVVLQRSICIDSKSYACVFLACGNLKALREAEQVHTHMIVRGIEPDVYLESNLLSMYAKCGNLSNASLVFEMVPSKNLFCWNAMMIAYSSHGSCEDVLGFYHRMQREGVQPNNYTFPCVLKACAGLEALKEGKEIHDFIITSGFESNIFVGNSLVTMYAKCGSMEDARNMFDKIPQRDVVSWNALIAGYVHNGYFNETLQLFHQMQRMGIIPNSVTIASVLPACAYLGDLQHGKEIHKYISRSGLQTDVLVWNALVTLYSKCGNLWEAHQVFHTMPKRDVVSWNVMIAGYAQNGQLEKALQLFHQMKVAGEMPNVSTWNGMIAGCAQNRQYNEALRLVREMQLANETPNSVTITSVLPACAHIAALERGMEMHNYITKRDLGLNVFVGTALIDMYAKCGHLDNARLVFEIFSQKSVVLWTAIISGYAIHGHGEDALALFYEMQNTGMKPDYVTFTAVLSACSHAGLADEGWRCFDSMSRDYQITPSVEHYACMVDLLGRAGRLDDAIEFVKNMPVEPDASVLGSLLAASRIHHNVELGEHVAQQLFELEPENTGNYVLLANIYSEAGRWVDAGMVRKLMKDRGLAKSPGCSWIEVKNNMHVFVVADTSHPETEKIYGKLESLAHQMKEEGYMPNTNYVLDGEDEEEEYMLHAHDAV